MRRVLLVLSILLVLSTCKKEDDPTVVVNASVADSSMGSIDFKAGSYAVGAAVTFSATPKTGYTFVSWTDSSTNQTYSNNPLTLTANDNTTLVANFEKTAYEINVNVTGNGQVQKQVVGGGTSFTHGATVELTAVPADQYSFFYWDNDPSDTTNPKTITLDGNKDVSAKFDYEVAKNLIGDWEFEIGGDSSSRNVTVIRMSVDIRLNVLMTTIVNGVMISQVFSKITPISTTAIVIGDFAVMTNVVVASPTSLSMSMVTLPENAPVPTKESEIPDNATPLNLSGKKSEEAPQKNESGIIIPPTEATTSSSTTEDIGSVFTDSINQITQSQSSTVAIETGTTSSTTGTTTSTESSNFCSNHAGKIWADQENSVVKSSYIMFFENTLTAGEKIAIEYEQNNNEDDECNIKKIGDNFEEISSGCSINAFIEVVENSSNYFRIKITEIYCNNSIPTSTGYMSFSVDNNIMTRTYEKNGRIEESNTYNIFDGNLNTNCFDLTSTSNTGVASQADCTISTSLISAPLTDQQRVPPGASITDIVYDIISDCPQIAHLVASSGLPNGVSASIINNNLKIAGTPLGQASGVYNYSITLDNHLEQTSTQPFVSATTSTVVNGSIIVINAGTTTTTNSTSTNDNTTSTGGGDNTGTTNSTGGGDGNNSVTTTPPADTTPPVITLNGQSSISLSVNYTYTEAGATASDNIDGNLTNNIVITGSVNTSSPGTYKVTYTVSDASNNTASIERTVIITPDTTAPIITLNGQSIIDVRLNTNFSDPGVNANDNVDGDISSSITSSGTVNTSSVGTYIINYSVADTAGNYNSVSRTVNVISVYFENGACKCPNATIGDTAIINGTTYTVVNNSTIVGQIANGNYNLCTTLVTNMKELFRNNSSFNSDIGFWDTSNVTNMEHIFASTPFNQNISNWDVSKVVTFERAFAYSSFNQPIGSWNISSATNISGMFRGSNENNKTVFNQDISGWNTSSIVIASEVFLYSIFNQNIGNWNMSNVRLLTAMFSYNTDFNQDISNWNLSSMTNNNNLINGANYGDARNRMEGMFRNATAFNQNLSNWCFPDISSEPDFFALNSALSNANKPLWGYCPSSFSINVTASNASDYTLNGTDRTGNVSGNDPTVTINVGDTVNFAVNASGHPFYLKTVQGTGTANTISGVTNNGTTNGTVSWTPTQAGTYYYICSLHAGMVGTITVN